MKEHYAVMRRGRFYELWTADARGENKRRIGMMEHKADALRWYDERKAEAGWASDELPREIR